MFNHSFWEENEARFFTGALDNLFELVIVDHLKYCLSYFYQEARNWEAPFLEILQIALAS